MGDVFTNGFGYWGFGLAAWSRYNWTQTQVCFVDFDLGYLNDLSLQGSEDCVAQGFVFGIWVVVESESGIQVVPVFGYGSGVFMGSGH